VKSGVTGAVCVLAVVASGCGGSSSSTTSTTTRAGAGPPTEVQLPTKGEPGRQVIVQSGCLACHQVGASGNRTLAPNLTHIGARLSRSAILRSLRGGPGIMPSFASLGERQLNEAADYLSQLK
jgi:menaquinol-cytochrome c reductase cytochrome b/c subunit